MMRRVSTIVLAVALGPWALAQTAGPGGGSSQQASIEKTLRTLSEEWANVPVTRDVAVLRRIWAADFVYVEASGRVINKDEGIADVARITDKITSAELSNVKVRVYSAGTVAIVIAEYREKGRAKNGKAIDHKSRFTNVWVLLNGSWQCVSGHSSDLPNN